MMAEKGKIAQTLVKPCFFGGWICFPALTSALTRNQFDTELSKFWEKWNNENVVKEVDDENDVDNLIDDENVAEEIDEENLVENVIEVHNAAIADKDNKIKKITKDLTGTQGIFKKIGLIGKFHDTSPNRKLTKFIRLIGSVIFSKYFHL